MTTEDNQTQPHSVTDRQLLAIDALLTGSTHSEAADSAGVHRCTVTGGANHHIGFITELNQRRQQRDQASADLLHKLIYNSLQLITDAINDGDMKAAITLLSRLDLQAIWKAGSPKAVTPLGVITDLAQQIDADILMDLIASPRSIELVEDRSGSLFDC